MKSRLTITLSESILQQIDRLIDKKTIRNRSHAIEHLIQQSLKPNVSTAVILAGGEKKDSFSPLKVLGNKPLILFTLDLLKKHNVKKVIITTNQQGKELTKLLGNGKSYGLEIEIIMETKPLGTAGALKNIETKLKDDLFFVVAGDVLTSIDLDAVATFHNTHQPLVTMAVKPRPAKKTYDNVFVQGHTIVDFQASKEHQVVGIVNSGVYLFSPKVLDLIPTNKRVMLEQDIFPTLTKSQQMIAFPFQGFWFDISTDENYHQALGEM